MKFKLKRIAQIAEILGGIAILISLLFVGIQLRENTKATRASTATSTIEVMSNWYITMGTDEESSASFWRFLSNPESFSQEDRLQHIYNLHSLFLAFQNSYVLTQDGTLDIRIHESLTQVINGVKEQPGFLLYWKSRKSIFFKEFQDYVDNIIQTKEKVSEGVYDEKVDNNQSIPEE